MNDYNWCHGPNCHKSHTQDRIRGVKGSKVLRTRKIPITSWNKDHYRKYFCSNSCYDEFASKYIDQIIAIAPRTEALETPIEVTTETRTDWRGQPYQTKVINKVDNNPNP